MRIIFGTTTYINYNVTDNSGYDDDLYFPTNYSNYWFSSPGAGSNQYLIKLNSGGYLENSNSYTRSTSISSINQTYTVSYNRMYIRPVVMLKTSVVEDMHYDSVGTVQLEWSEEETEAIAANMELTYEPTSWSTSATVYISLTDTTLQAKVKSGAYVFQWTTDDPDSDDCEWHTLDAQDTNALTVTENCYIYVRLSDGTRSGEYASAYINIIDNQAPNTPTISASVNLDSVTLTISGSDADEVVDEETGLVISGQSKIDYYVFEIYNNTTGIWLSTVKTTDGVVTSEYKTTYAATSYSITNLISDHGVDYGDDIWIYAYAVDKAGNWSQTAGQKITDNYHITDVSLVSQAETGDWVKYGVDINEDENSTNDWRLFYVTGGVIVTYPADTTVLLYEDTTVTFPAGTTVSYLADTTVTTESGDSVTYSVDSETGVAKVAYSSETTLTMTADVYVTLSSETTITYGDDTTEIDSEDATGITTTDNGQVFIITADYIEADSDLLMSSEYDTEAQTGTGMTTLLGRSYVLYWTSTTLSSYSTVTAANPVNTTTNKIFMAEWADYYENMSTSNYNVRAILTLLNTNNWANFVDSSYAEYAIGSPTLEMWVAAWNLKYGEDVYDGSTGGKTLYIGNQYTDDDGETQTRTQGYYINSVPFDDEIYDEESGLTNAETWTTYSYYIYVNGVYNKTTSNGTTSYDGGYYDSIFFPFRKSSGDDGTYVARLLACEPEW